MSDVLVNVDNVSKRFCRSLKRSLWTGLQDLGSEIGGRRDRRGAMCRRPAWRNYDGVMKGL